ncbi:MAG TPA: M28 family peptidase [Ignavibacteria bacterium]|nr:M28 family peptidase [Ignavibacteria bacterium]HMQ98566.1 M28 family peptidase [Ignavibacteria bacterium]
MKKYIILFNIVFLVGFFIRPQNSSNENIISGVNNVPVINITGTELISSINAVKITYTLSDAENNPCRISLRISNDSGKSFLFPADSTSGDIGYPVLPGNNKQLYWYYTAMPLGFKAKIVADDLQEVDIQAIVNQVDSNEIKSSMQFITGIRHRTAGINQLQRVKDSINNRFARYNLQTSVQEFVYSGYNAQNFIGRLPGTTREDTTYIVCGHYETVSISPGADDNGTAVAAVLEISRILSNYKFRNTVKFIGFDLEEAGLVGSARYVSQGIPSYEKIAGVVDFEMIGYYCDVPNCQQIPPGFCTLFPAVCDSINSQQGRGNFLNNIANVNSNSLRYAFDSCARIYTPQLRVISLATPGNGQSTPDLRRSDHAPFWDAGYKALMLTDGANFRNPNYHTANDVLSTINIAFLTNNIKATLAAIASLAGIQHSSYSVSDYIGLIGINLISAEIPEKYVLQQNYPNPFNPSTKINFSIPFTGNVKLSVYDIAGNEVSVLNNGQMAPGNYSADFDATNLSSGVYFYKLVTDEFSATKRMILVK